MHNAMTNCPKFALQTQDDPQTDCGCPDGLCGIIVVDFFWLTGSKLCHCLSTFSIHFKNLCASPVEYGIAG